MGTTEGTAVDVKPRSRDVTDGLRRAPARAMLRAVGITDDDWDKPQIGVANSWNEITPCNMTLRTLAEHVKRGRPRGRRRAAGVRHDHGVATASRWATRACAASLVSREVITDSVETVVFAERLDGFVGMAGCDKSMPAMLMAAARLDLPSVLVYNGSIMPGELDGRALDITSVFEAIGAYAAGTITDDDLRGDRAQRLPRRGRVRRDVHRQHDELDRRGARHERARLGVAAGHRRPPQRRRPAAAGAAVVSMLRLGITPRQIMTKPAFENAIALTSALGGSTNAVLHLLAIAHEAGVALDLDDFNRIAARVPHIADMKPGGKFHMSDLDRVGGVPVVLAHLLDAGLLARRRHHGAPARTMAENLAALDPPPPDGVVVHPLDAPIHTEGGINVLTGSLAPNGSVVKVAGLTDEQQQFEGPARVFDGEDGAMAAILAGDDRSRAPSS